MAICTNWAALVSRVLDREAYAAWLDKFIETNGLPHPVTDPCTDHDFGLNFSRAWGLWDMYDKTGRADVANAYAEHFHRGFAPAVELERQLRRRRALGGAVRNVCDPAAVRTGSRQVADAGYGSTAKRRRPVSFKVFRSKTRISLAPSISTNTATRPDEPAIDICARPSVA